MADKKPRQVFIQSQTFFDADRWDAHARIGELMAQGVTQIAVAFERDEWTVSWPSIRPANPLAPSPGVAA